MYGGAAVLWKWAKEMGGAAPGIATFLDSLSWFEILVSSLCRCRAKVLFLVSFTSLFACRVTILVCDRSTTPATVLLVQCLAALTLLRLLARCHLRLLDYRVVLPSFALPVAASQVLCRPTEARLHHGPYRFTYARVYSRCNAASVILRHHPTQHAWLPQYVSPYALGR
jgi:hypothetical protein